MYELNIESGDQDKSMKIVSMAMALMLLIGCSSEYSPTETMIKLRQNMTEEKALAVLQDAIWRDAGPVSVCASRGFWYDEGANFRIGKDKIKLLAYRKGKFIRSEGKGFDRQDYYVKEYYDYVFSFNDMQYIGLYQDPSVLTVYKSCHKLSDKQNLVVIDLHISEESNIKFTALPDDLDRVMAAFSVILPEMTIKQYRKFGR